MEGKKWVWNNGIIQENEVSTIKRNLDVPTKKREELALRAFEQFLSKL